MTQVLRALVVALIGLLLGCTMTSAAFAAPTVPVDSNGYNASHQDAGRVGATFVGGPVAAEQGAFDEDGDVSGFDPI